MTDFFLGNWSYLGLILILVLTGAGLPLPEEVPVIAAGVLSSLGQMNPWLAFLSCVIGALAGDTVMYWLGRHFGRSILREQSWWAKIIHPEREARIERLVKNHGLKVLFLSRFLVGIRAPVYVAAGILHIPYRRFILMDLLCATAVVGLFFGVSYWFGEAITKWIRDAEYVATGLVALTILTAVIYFWRRHKRKKLTLLQEKLLRIDLEQNGETLDEEASQAEAHSEEKELLTTADSPWKIVEPPEEHEETPAQSQAPIESDSHEMHESTSTTPWAATHRS